MKSPSAFNDYIQILSLENLLKMFVNIGLTLAFLRILNYSFRNTDQAEVTYFTI